MKTKAGRMIRTLVSAAAVLVGCTSALADMPSANEYVQGGLVMQLDGIERGDDPSVWTDLSGNGFDWALDSANCTWKDIGLHFDGKGVCGSLVDATKSFAGKVKTIEFVYANETTASESIIFTPGLAYVSYVYTQGQVVGLGSNNSSALNGFGNTGSKTNGYHAVYNDTNSWNGVSELVMNGMSREAVKAGNWWGCGAVAALGNRNNGSASKPAKGILMALRIYDRVLTPAERIQNEELDRERFGVPDERRRFDVTARGSNGGLVSINGGPFAASVTETLIEGSEVTVAVQEPVGTKFLWWKREDVERLEREGAFSFVLQGQDTVVDALFHAEGSGVDARLGRYSTDGLLGWWDGIANAGAGQAHDDSAMVWTSIVGAGDLTLHEGMASFVSNALVCVASQQDVNAACTKAISNVLTLEIVMDPPASDQAHIAFTAGGNTRMVATYAAGTVLGASGGYRYTVAAAPNAFTFTYSGSSVKDFYEGGMLNEAKGSADTWSSAPTTCAIGVASKYAYAGHVYAIRLYDRELSEVEIANNAQVDGVRFFGKSEDEHAVADVRGSGAVSVNGGEAKSEQEIDAEPGDEVTLTAVPGEGMSFVAWETEGLALTGDARKTNPLTFTFTPAVRRITAVFAASGSAEQEVTQYSFDGLAAFWDGVVNVGFGLAHDNDATAWKDLVGQRDLQLIEGNAEFADNALNCVRRSRGAAAGPAMTASGLKTVEVVCEQPSSSSIILSGGGEVLLIAGSGFIQYLREAYKNVTSTNLATYAFAQMDGRGWVFFENGAERSERGGFETWAAGGGIFLGSRDLDGGNSFVGRIHAVRLYTRALSAAELAHHSDIDQRRFFDCAEVPADRGIRFRPDGSAEYRLRVSANRGGQVSVNGVAAGSGDLWFPEGESVTLAAHPDASHQFAGWVDDTRSAILDDAVPNTNVTFAIKSATSVGCSFVRSYVLRHASAASYAQDGLVAQWDGIERGNDPAVWTDLSGNGRNWALDLANGAWTAQGLAMDGIGRLGTFVDGAPALEKSDLRTMEVVYANGAGAQNTIVFVPGTDNGYYIYTDGQNRVGYYGVGTRRYGNAVSLGSTNRFNVVCGSTTVESAFVNASPRMNDGMADWWRVGNEASLGGLAASKPAKGEIMAIRIYNRVLTADERLLNAKLDAIRFLGEPAPAVPGLMILLR